jgi:hypothetical protein
MLAKPPEVSAQKAVWLASPATDGKTGLVVSLFSPWKMISGAAREALGYVRKRPPAPIEVHLTTIPPFTVR